MTNRRVPRYLVITFLVLGLCMMWPLPGAVMADTPNVHLDPASADTQAGQTIEMRLRVENVNGLYGLDVRFDFEPSLLEVLDTDTEREGVQVTSGDFPYPDFVVRNTVDGDAGTIWYAVIQLNPREPTSGSGVMLTIRFRAKAAGTAIIGISSLQLVNRDGIEIAATKQGGQVVIATASGSTPPPALPTRTASPTPTPSPTSPPTATLVQQIGATATSALPTATLVPGAPTLTPAPTHTPVPGQTPSSTPSPLPGVTLPPLTPYPGGPPGLPTGGTLPGGTPGAGAPPGVPPALPNSPLPGSTVMPGGATATRQVAAPTILRATRAATAAGVPPTAMPAAAPTLAATSALVAAVIPTARPPATPAPPRQVSRPLIPQGMFICLAIMLVLLAVVLFLYLVRRRYHAIE